MEDRGSLFSSATCKLMDDQSTDVTWSRNQGQQTMPTKAGENRLLMFQGGSLEMICHSWKLFDNNLWDSGHIVQTMQYTKRNHTFFLLYIIYSYQMYFYMHSKVWASKFLFKLVYSTTTCRKFVISIFEGTVNPASVTYTEDSHVNTHTICLEEWSHWVKSIETHKNGQSCYNTYSLMQS